LQNILRLQFICKHSKCLSPCALPEVPSVIIDQAHYAKGKVNKCVANKHTDYTGHTITVIAERDVLGIYNYLENDTQIDCDQGSQGTIEEERAQQIFPQLDP
jgi:hypothetical protein